ncbi:G-type lectin S-receptor-like serine/threonine-protein kinase At1g11300 [Momordica charantia]|uniref:Receptor-like serine/threonine-protein kinase n=1 Tax=Momordica charantia TaxID=3673 RepID=A0A6J1CEQ2_MOMCH|nr:G-type lectin S-receptor-like serine/threonine-protein kinase At1g11300 [Momordica charantia]
MKPVQNYWSFSGRLLLLSFTCFYSSFCFGRDTITSTNFIKDPATIISNSSSFELGFFTPVNSTSRYVGIWFKQQISVQMVVWVANRDNPLHDAAGIFTISKDGNLVVLDGNNAVVWSSNISSSSSSGTNTSARISDTGNLVLEDTASGLVLWESFKHPTHAYLPSMEFITNTKTDEEIGLTSWNTPSDPSMGNFSLTLFIHNIPENVIWNGRTPYWRSGPWNGQTFIGMPEMKSVYLSGNSLLIEDQTYHLTNGQKSMYIFLSSQGNVERRAWDSTEERWKVIWSAPRTQCDFYGACGAFGFCNAKASPVCRCLRGFKPKQEEEWNQGNWSGGCVRITPVKCGKFNTANAEEDGFSKVEMVKVPFLAEWSNSSATADDCKHECLKNCSCSAYAYENGIHCMLWKSDLIDIQKFESGGADVYLRLAYADLDHTIPSTEDVKHKKGIIIALVVAGMFIISIIVIYFSWRWKTHKHAKKTRGKKMSLFNELRGNFLNSTMGHRIGDNLNQELPTYDLEKLEIATNHFHMGNKLGEGGFGPVYKGRLVDGQEIAVKRLSTASAQGLEEFINEVTVISKLQHRNLVRLFGCCVEAEEKMLIYEYMPNLSLDAFIFDSSKQKLLDWGKRLNIIRGIARGLLYLHKDSRLKIIHRDLKASNILLDENFNPKISDFGMARIFGNNEDQASTLRVVGTYGYMSPEYAMQGRFSEKSDVFSFGVLLLEIISGRKNTSFCHDENVISLLGLAWKLWNEENLISLIDPAIHDSCHHTEILRCMHIGLLCVQEAIKDRPNMLTILSMLNSEIIDLYPPKQPGFTSIKFESNTNLAQHSQGKRSVNMVTITKIEGR